jgi:DNA-binding MarR family transcriptional regulator
MQTEAAFRAQIACRQINRRGQMSAPAVRKARATSALSPHRILYLVKQAQHKTYVALEAALQPVGVTAVQFRILAAIAAQRQLSSAELSRIFGVTPQTMIKQIAALEAKNQVRRKMRSSNKRVLEMELTPEGWAALTACDEAAEKVEAEILRPFTAEEQDQFRNFLLRMIKRPAGTAGEG